MVTIILNDLQWSTNITNYIFKANETQNYLYELTQIVYKLIIANPYCLNAPTNLDYF
jgi:hypothetical protein